MDYLPRIADASLGARLSSAGAVLIEGPRACGKTSTARRQATSEVRLDVDASSRAAVDVAPQALLAQPAPLLIDEWQVAPDIWNLVRRAVDDRQAKGQFILTGSAQPVDDVARHSGAGRISVIRMRPMCLAESGESSGRVSLSAVLAGHEQSAPAVGLTVAELASLLVRGGWPALLGRSGQDCRQFLHDYLDQTCHLDLPAMAGRRRDPQKVRILLRSLARHTASQAAISTIAADLSQFGESIDRKTASTYMHALTRLLILEQQPAWSPALRSRAHTRVSPKHHLVDPSLAAEALGASAERLLRDPETFGLLLESLVIRDLRVLSEPLGATVYHYRDNLGLEVDAVVQGPSGNWAAFEVKLGQRSIDAAAATLLAFKGKVDTRLCGEPSALGVITAEGPAYRRKDGVHVLPVSCLGP